MALHLLEDHYLHSRQPEDRAQVEAGLLEVERSIDPAAYRARVRARAGGFRTGLGLWRLGCIIIGYLGAFDMDERKKLRFYSATECPYVAIASAPGTTLTTGTNLGGGLWSVPAASMGTLAVRSPLNYSGTFSVGVTNGLETEMVSVIVTPVADTPILSTVDAIDNEDTVGVSLADPPMDCSGARMGAVHSSTSACSCPSCSLSTWL